MKALVRLILFLLLMVALMNLLTLGGAIIADYHSLANGGEALLNWDRVWLFIRHSLQIIILSELGLLCLK